MDIKVITLSGDTARVEEKLQRYYGFGWRLIGTYESDAQVGGAPEGWCAILQKG